jgi:hypothetical protein
MPVGPAIAESIIGPILVINTSMTRRNALPLAVEVVHASDCL